MTRTPEQLLDGLRAAAADAGRAHLPLQVYQAWRKRNPDAASVSQVIRVWGSWTDACAAAGLIPRGSSARARWTAPRAIAALKEVAAQQGVDHLTKDAYDAAREPGRHPDSTTTVKLAHTWNAAHETAGLIPYPRGRAYQRKWTDEQLWEVVTTYLVRCETDGLPRTRTGFGEWLKSQPDSPSTTHVYRRLGPWTQLIRHPRVRPNPPTPRRQPPAPESPTEGLGPQRSVTVRIPEDALDRLDDTAERHGLSRTGMVRKLVLDRSFIQAPHHHRRRHRSGTELARTVAKECRWWFDENDRLMDDDGLLADSIEDAAAAMQDLTWFASPSPGLGVLWERMPADHTDRASAVRERLDLLGRHPAVNGLAY